MTTQEFINIIDNYISLDINDQRTNVSYLYELTDKLNETEDTILAIEPILKLIEKYPTTEFGSPGPLVHIIERFRGHYEQKLLDTLDRTHLTVWMLNRIINGTKDETIRNTLIKILHHITQNPTVDTGTKESGIEFL